MLVQIYYPYACQLIFHLQSNQVNDVMWNIGLNPYDYLAECYGGIPNQDGIIRELGNHIEMMHPDAVSMPKHRYEDYMKVFCIPA